MVRACRSSSHACAASIADVACTAAAARASSPTFTPHARIICAMARVLVVDDEPAVRRALERALRLENHDVTLAADGEEALDALAGGPPTR